MAPQMLKQDSDGVARAAVDRAEKLEAQVKTMAAELALLRSAGRNQAVVTKAGPLPEEYRGTKTYRLTVAHYRKGEFLQAGEQITVTEEIPSKTWVLLEKATPTARLVDAPVAALRPSDAQV